MRNKDMWRKEFYMSEDRNRADGPSGPYMIQDRDHMTEIGQMGGEAGTGSGRQSEQSQSESRQRRSGQQGGQQGGEQGYRRREFL
jgi:general stress protein YciG